MAASLLALLDDITTVLDDVAIMTKAAVKKSAAVLGDDLALNAQMLTGIHARRELPVVWTVAKGSLVNKAILVPSALILSAVAPSAVTPLLIIGGAFLCFEGMEKVAHKFLHRGENTAPRDQGTPISDAAGAVTVVDGVSSDKERQKIRGAIRTDFVLSAEIVVITLGTVMDQPFGNRVAVLVAIALLMTVGVYGFVAGIIKLDDLGLALSKRQNALAQAMGYRIISYAPWFMRGLSILGTAAMFLVGGGILTHGVGFLHHASSYLMAEVSSPLNTVLAKLFDGVVGMALGGLVLALLALGKRLLPSQQHSVG